MKERRAKKQRDFSAFRFSLRPAVEWLRRGRSPPRTHRKSMVIMSFLLLFGFGFLALWLLALLDIGGFGAVPSRGSLLVCAFLTLCPGLYALWIAACCWRGVAGYRWDMIPYFD